MKVFILEDDLSRMQVFWELFGKDDVTWIDSCQKIDRFQPPYDLICLDHDLGGSQMGMKHGRPLSLAEAEDCGATFVNLVKDKINPDAVVMVHSYNIGAAKEMVRTLRAAGLNQVVDHPFGGRDFNGLIGRVKEYHGEDSSREDSSEVDA